jgi:uncharacterized membrane protein YbaN (DUF454 family)
MQGGDNAITQNGIANAETPRNDPISRTVLGRIIWIVAGTFFLIIGLIGIVLPVLPTTPFLLLAAACYLRGSRRMYNWLLENRIFGNYLKDYYEKRGVPIRVKIGSVIFLWCTIGLSIIIIGDLILGVVLLIVAAGVTLHIASLKTRVHEHD